MSVGHVVFLSIQDYREMAAVHDLQVSASIIEICSSLCDQTTALISRWDE